MINVVLAATHLFQVQNFVMVDAVGAALATFELSIPPASSDRLEAFLLGFLKQQSPEKDLILIRWAIVEITVDAYQLEGAYYVGGL
jgi:hypothetical protein